MPVTQKEYLLTHHQTGGSQSRQEDEGKGIKPIPPTNGLRNQLAKRANSSLSSKEKLAGAHRWTYSALELVSSSGHMFLFQQGREDAGSRCRAGEKWGGSPKQVVSAAARNVPLRPPPGQVSQEWRFLASIPARCPGLNWIQENPGVSSAAPPEAPETVIESVWARLLTHQKPIKRQGWWKGKLGLFPRPATAGRGACLQRPSPATDDHWARALLDAGRGQEQRRRLCQSSWNWSCGDLVKCSCLQFQYRCVPISLTPALRVVAVYVMAIVWASCS